MISVIIPVYNAEKFLARCLDSIVHQTYKDLEILIINDASADDSQKIIDQYAQKDPRIKVFVHEKNKGSSGPSRNTGLDHASGKYINFVDSDDFLALDAYEKLIAILEKEDLDILSFGYFELEKNKKTAFLQKKLVFPFFENQQEKINFVMTQGAIPFIMCNKIYKRSIFEEGQKFRFLEHTYYEDLPATIYLLIKAQSFRQIADPYYYYYQQENSITHQKLTSKHITDYLKIRDDFDKIAVYFSFSDQNKKLLQNRFIECLLYFLKRYIKKGKENDFMPIFIQFFPDLLSPIIASLVIETQENNLLMHHKNWFTKIGYLYLKTVFFIREKGFGFVIKKIIHRF